MPIIIGNKPYNTVAHYSNIEQYYRSNPRAERTWPLPPKDRTDLSRSVKGWDLIPAATDDWLIVWNGPAEETYESSTVTGDVVAENLKTGEVYVLASNILFKDAKANYWQD
ncbi:hypothetical protein [Bifidobacterium bifidum]|uniref:hypothetical protein n=1 Tax=Bifidobacterium bifidum TaxID=1681 RepID=UPI003D04D4C6